MRQLYFFIVGLTLLSCSKSLTPTAVPTFHINDTNKDLVGTWEFVEMRDNQNKKVDTIRHGGFGYEIATGPLLTYKKDGSYSKQFTPENIDNGFWTFDSKTNKIIHYLLIDATTMIGNDLVKRGLAKKYADGNYYEIIEDKIIINTKNDIQVYRSEKLTMTYKKRNNGD